MDDHGGHHHPVIRTTTEMPGMMDHAAHGHGQEMQTDDGAHDMPHSMMSMFFHFGYDEVVLFSFWKIDSAAGMIGSCIGIFILAMLYEGLRVFRECFLQKSLCDKYKHDLGSIGSSATGNGAHLLTSPPIDGINQIDSVSVRMQAGLRPNPLSWSHILQTFLHMLQVFISYLLMLVFMTYNVWLCIAVILGAGAGYFMFGWRKTTTLDYEHCH